MGQIEERIAALVRARDDAQAEIERLTSTKNGDVLGFLKQAEAGGSLPLTVTLRDAALLIDLWEKYKEAGEIPATRSIPDVSPATSEGESNASRPN